MAPLSQADLEAAHCWEPGDRVPGRPAMTELRRALRYQQAQWREAHGHPIGTQPIRPKPGGPRRLVGSRLPLDYARDTGANFLTSGARDAATARTATKEPRQTFDLQRLWADLLWPTPLAFNLFGDLAYDLELADRAVHTWWPDTPGVVSEVRFDHSPGRLDPDYLGSLSTFEAAFVLDLDDGSHGMVGVTVRYHELIHPETPKPARLQRYRDVAARSGAFARGSVDAIEGQRALTVTWLNHLLALSMVQHPGGDWGWARSVLVHLAANTDYADAAASYRDLLEDRVTFSSMTLEDLLAAGALPPRTATALSDRYLVA